MAESEPPAGFKKAYEMDLAAVYKLVDAAMAFSAAFHNGGTTEELAELGARMQQIAVGNYMSNGADVLTKSMREHKFDPKATPTPRRSKK